MAREIYGLRRAQQLPSTGGPEFGDGAPHTGAGRSVQPLQGARAAFVASARTRVD